MFGITTAQFASGLRSILTFIGGYVLAKGWVDAATLEMIIGGLVAIGSAIWGITRHTDNAKLASAAKVLEDPVKVEAADKKVVAEVVIAAAKT